MDTKTIKLDAYQFMLSMDNLKALNSNEYRAKYGIKSIEDCQCVAEEVMAGFIDDNLDDQLSFDFINSKLTR